MFGILLLVLLIILIYITVIRIYSTWTKEGIKQTNALYLLGDTAGPILGQQSFSDMIKGVYNSFPGERYFGMYQLTLPTLMIRDPELIKTLAIKDFDHFANRRQFIPDGVEPVWTNNLVFMKDKEWKKLRTVLSPSFTSSKMRGIFNLISECCETYVQYFQRDNLIKPVELKDMVTRYTNDVIVSVAFGIKCDCINERDNEFYSAARSIERRITSNLLASASYTLFPNVAKALNIPFLPRKAITFFTNVIKETLKTRKEQGVVRPDMIQLLLETIKENNAKTNGNKLEITDEHIAAQAFIFYLGGFQTVSTILLFMGHSLTTHPIVQKKLQEEIDRTIEKCGGELTYEALLKMKYLDMVVSETLRKWPSLPVLDRVCTKPYTLPPNNDKGRPLRISPGQPILIPTIALHYDPEYFPNPEVFDPERFSDEDRDKINQYAYTPFGIGPRNCIGSRLAMLEIKLFYFHFLLNFDFVRTDKTKSTLTLSKRSFPVSTDDDVFVGIKPRIK